MKTLMIAIIIGLLIVGAVIAAVMINVTPTSNNAVKTSGCSSCSGTCTAQKNCGLSTCGATTGKTCTCGK